MSLSGTRDLGRMAERRRMALAVVGDQPAVAARVASAPDAFLRDLTMSDVARSCRLLDPPPRAGRVEVAVTPGGGTSRWYVDVAGRDRPRLLVAITGALSEAQLDVRSAAVATWPDGAVLDTFVVSSSSSPDAAVLTAAITRNMGRPLSSPPLRDARMTFRSAGSVTVLDVSAPDRPGLLHALATGFASAGVDVHTARIATVGARANDQFELAGRRGGQLDAGVQATLRAAVTMGVGLGSR